PGLVDRRASSHQRERHHPKADAETTLETVHLLPHWHGAFALYRFVTAARAPCRQGATLELVPEELVRHFVVELHLGDLHLGAERLRAAVSRRRLQLGELLVHHLAEQLLRE